MALDFNDDDEEVEEGEAWISSFADMVTLLLGFFMILYSLSHMDEKKFYEYGKSIASSFKKKQVIDTTISDSDDSIENRRARAFQMMIAILNLGDERTAVEKVERAYSEMTSKEDSQALAAKILSEDERAAALVRREEADESTVISLALQSEVLFRSGRAELLPGSRKKVRELAPLLVDLQDLGYIEVTGHTDSVPPSPNGRYPDNWTLSAARAATVARELQAAGLKANKLRVKGMASYAPLFPERDRQGRLNRLNMQRNRRIEIAVKKGES